jgi:homocysteine S-methyltransferase
MVYTGLMTLRDQLDLQELRVLDGGLATQLEQMGCDLSGPLWSAEVLWSAPERVRQVHRSFLEAGADCIMTASYQVSEMGFEEVGLDPSDAAAALRQSVHLTLQARSEYRQRHPRPVWVAASLGPYGAALHNGAEYHGNYEIPFSALVEFHARRVAVLAATDADFLAFETIPSLEEARAILEALRSFPALAACVSFQCRDTVHVAHGESLADCARLLAREPQIVAVGVNCIAPAQVLSLLAILKSERVPRIAVYPNSGERWDAATRSWSGRNEPGDLAALAGAWRAAGADWIGGCCRTGPAHIRAIRQALQTALPPPALMRQ